MIMWLLLTRGLQYTIDGNDVLAAASTLYIANTHEPEMKRIFFFPIHVLCDKGESWIRTHKQLMLSIECNY